MVLVRGALSRFKPFKSEMAASLEESGVTAEMIRLGQVRLGLGSGLRGIVRVRSG